MPRDSYSLKDKIARCSECSRFMPWPRSRQVGISDGEEEPSLVYVEGGICVKCEEREVASA